MHDILILGDGAVPENLAGSGRWPGLRIDVSDNLTLRDLCRRLQSEELPDAVIVNTGTADADLKNILAGLACPSVEVLAHNPNRHADGTPDLTAEPVGAGAIVYGFGDACFETALSLLAEQLSGPAR